MEDTANRVKRVISEAMALDLEEFDLNSRLQTDLGAESIDYLDITFRLEREFGVKLKPEEIFPTGLFNGQDGYIKDGKVTAEGVQLLKDSMPFADFSKWEVDAEYERVADIFTVGSLVNFMEMQQKVI